MGREKSYETCQTYIAAQCRRGEDGVHREETGPKPFITLSRQTGAGGVTVGEKLAEHLSAREKKGTYLWAVFDKNLVERVAEEHHLPERIRPFLKEDKISEIEDILDEFFGLHPSQLVLVRKTSSTILHLAQLGHVILVGRGANILTRKLRMGLHVRLVGSLPRRIKHIQEYYGLDEKGARRFIDEEDAGRRNYLKNYFNKDINDPLLYDLVLNTDEIPYEEASRIIGEAALVKWAASAPAF